MRILVAGVALRGSGYPNAWQTIRVLREKLELEIVECGQWLPEDFHLWKLTQGSRIRAMWSLSGFLLGNLFSMIKVLMRHRNGDVVYVPYPGMFLLWMASFVPSRFRPRCLVDAYISVWDTLYRDRSMGKGAGLVARLLAWVEGRALRAAWRVIVDTQANREYMVCLFGLQPHRVLAIPLAIDEALFRSDFQRSNDDKTVNVLFVGTFVPLHGIDTLLKGIQPLFDDGRFRFTLLGDGQSASILANALQLNKVARIEWIRDWQPLERIAERIGKADICLGVFGGQGKASRVLPFKLYMYMAMGKPVINQAWLSWPDGAPRPPVVGTENASDIHSALLMLADDAIERRTLSQKSHDYYFKWLSNERVAEAWRVLLGS